MTEVKRYLKPLAALYGAAVAVRGWLFDSEVLHSRSFALPVICVGNITVGGTGKTPHTEYLIRLLCAMGKRVAVLSRGYGRSTHGYVVADDQTTAFTIGDEPLQMHLKFPDVTVAVCESRVTGIERLLERDEPPTAILLDDAFQHRYVKAGLNVVLVDYHRPVYEDALLPAGRLREPMTALERADIVVVTKCPKRISPIDIHLVETCLHLRPWQKLFFTRMVYGSPYALFPNAEGEHRHMTLLDLRVYENVMLLSGIARPEYLADDMASYCLHTTIVSFPDHHTFTRRDVERINTTFDAMIVREKLILTTEKDATRLIAMDGLSDKVREAIYVLPMSVEFVRNDQDAFDKSIKEAVLR